MHADGAGPALAQRAAGAGGAAGGLAGGVLAARLRLGPRVRRPPLLGITIFVLAAARLLWRATHPAPPPPAGSPRGTEVVGRITHWLLYALLVAIPVTGYLQSASVRPVSYLGLFDLLALPENGALDDACKTLHLLGQWTIYGLVALHLLATAWHVAVRRDGLPSRMLPPHR